MMLLELVDRAFHALERGGVIALPAAGFGQSDGLEAVEEEYHAGGEEANYAGHCFYTAQDRNDALDGAGMYVGFGHRSGDDAKGIAVGLRLRAALEAEGLNVEWDGTINRRQFVTV